MLAFFLMDGAHCIQITADRGGIAAGRDVHYINCSYRPCPTCELRLIAADARRCKTCTRKARDLCRARIGSAAAAGFAVCMLIGLSLSDGIGVRDARWSFAGIVAVSIFCLGAWAWTRVDALSRLRYARLMLRRPARLTRILWRSPMRMWSAMTAPSRRVPGSDEEMRMEPNPVEEARAAKLCAEAAKLMAESARINAQARWFPLLTVAGLFTAAIVVVRFLL